MSDHYTYRAQWSQEDQEYVGLCAEFPSLSWLASAPRDAIAGIEELVAEVVTDMGDEAPQPLTERRYSGRMLVRTSPALHARLTIEAAEQGVSVNQWVNQKLTEQS